MMRQTSIARTKQEVMYFQQLSVILVLLGAMRIPAQSISRGRWSKHRFHRVVQCANPTVSNLVYYGSGCSCVCGRTDNQPVGEFDRCCQVRTDCYGEVKKMGCYSPMIQYYIQCENEIPKCVPSMSFGDDCDEKLCNCDVEAALCLRKHSHNYNKEFLQYDQTPV
ncbi:basic phospholipase A2-like [Mustelus asterias]